MAKTDTAATAKPGSEKPKRKAVARPGIPLSGMNKNLLKQALNNYRPQVADAPEHPLVDKEACLKAIDKMIDILNGKVAAPADAPTDTTAAAE